MNTPSIHSANCLAVKDSIVWHRLTINLAAIKYRKARLSRFLFIRFIMIQPFGPIPRYSFPRGLVGAALRFCFDRTSSIDFRRRKKPNDIQWPISHLAMDPGERRRLKDSSLHIEVVAIVLECGLHCSRRNWPSPKHYVCSKYRDPKRPK